MQYCENVSDCRRAQQLHYLGESVDKRLCEANPDTACDNCSSGVQFNRTDMTELAQCVIRSVRQMTSGRGNQFTLNYVIDVLRGSKIQRILQLGHHQLEMYGKGPSGRSDVERFVHKLALDGLLKEEMHLGMHDNIIGYVQLGKRSHDLLNGKARFLFDVPLDARTRRPAVTSSSAQVSNEARQQLGTDCLKALREWRSKVARKFSATFKPHWIVGDDALEEMATTFPVTKQALQAISGLVPTYLDHYGDEILQVIEQYAPVNGTAVPEERVVDRQPVEESVYWGDPCFVGEGMETVDDPVRTTVRRFKHNSKKQRIPGRFQNARGGVRGRGRGTAAGRARTQTKNATNSATASSLVTSKSRSSMTFPRPELQAGPKPSFSHAKVPARRSASGVPLVTPGPKRTKVGN